MGILTAAGILAETAALEGYDVKRSELHGMSQRGGAVTSDIRFGAKIFSPMIPDGETDYLLLMAAETDDTFQAGLREGGLIISSTILNVAGLPPKKGRNIALLGALSVKLDLRRENWINVLQRTFGQELSEPNIAWFNLGGDIMNQSIAGQQP